MATSEDPLREVWAEAPEADPRGVSDFPLPEAPEDPVPADFAAFSEALFAFFAAFLAFLLAFFAAEALETDGAADLGSSWLNLQLFPCLQVPVAAQLWQGLSILCEFG